MHRADLDVLCCPVCRGTLTFHGSQEGAELRDGRLRCECGRTWKVRDGIPILVDEHKVRGTDRFMRCVYDSLACLHDPAAWVLLPVMQGSGVDRLRHRYMPKLELGALRAEGRPVRILEVGVGTGANLPLIEHYLPAGLDAEIWGCDLSAGMLARCRDRVADGGDDSHIHLSMADAHFLPFKDSTFDRVFHIGGIAGYRHPALALSEMARVAKPDTPIVVVDEQLDRRRWQSPYHRLMFCALTFYTDHVTSPVGAVPAKAKNVRSEQISRFYYCLRFEMPEVEDPASSDRQNSGGSAPLATPADGGATPAPVSKEKRRRQPSKKRARRSAAKSVRTRARPATARKT